LQCGLAYVELLGPFLKRTLIFDVNLNKLLVDVLYSI